MTKCSQLLLISAFLAFLAGCASVSPQPVLPSTDSARRERVLGEAVFPSLISRLRLVQDIELDIYLRNVVKELVRASEVLKDSPVGVQIYRDPEGKLSSYSVPGLRILLSLQALKALRYENELASLLAFEISKVEAGLLLPRIAAAVGSPSTAPEFAKAWTPQDLRKALPNTPDFFSGTGYFAFTREEKTAALKSAVSYLHAGGFDPRGVLVLIDSWKSAATKSPWPVSELSEVRAEVRTELNTLPPLRNPVVRSEEFVGILKRIEKL